ncbi:T-complex protein 1 subunit eta-like protein [Tanacetum coccineum]
MTCDNTGAPDHWRLVRAMESSVGLHTEDDYVVTVKSTQCSWCGRIFCIMGDLLPLFQLNYAFNTLVSFHLIGNGITSKRGAKNIRVHMLADGRDVLDGSSVGFVETLEAELASLRSKGIDAHDRDIFCAGRVAEDDLNSNTAATCEEQVGNERFNIFSICPSSMTATIVLRGGADQFIEEAERSLHDAIMIVRRAMKNSTVVVGGGAIDVCLCLLFRM